ncbi:cytosolic Fe-S cluster assembly factor cfd1 [Exophiala xenobiotica]|uniref:Cytosolic Fe-S cluster assembly factor cfd1 n=1 Tax=Vermiconidia calcicola TaxID=1690605 RepID=A0AAV9Q3T5_9PEZI|nr:cytosolic Fe-S cluster assembly factor cfd1 [Exophiala xenobiotica]KAK5532986.1 cytosolic Fe-S cluster assembly factor cfd1 [Vermiconidia calcicola]KAK5191676.1 cytosolic Fe-S cluster assembly factor cfd1 [Exophiala xenobiotica]KAK5211237.1 cytosolic Fe-S cluster assembly factor cfd1 [Exophiala xenobiotica]KAK5218759.1 cytosolic Fe-S cluster assembly factor cfd1 [Exophiala xenobiotica]
MGLDNIKHVVLVLSGKGGVGKSSVTLQLALSLTQQGHNVGILDIDLTGPSIPRLLNLEDKKVTQAPGGWLPVKVHDARDSQVSDPNGEQSASASKRGSLHALSLAFLLPSRSSAVIWRGPKKTAMIRQFVSDVLWPPNTDYLLIDTPPGTSDEHIAIVEELHKLAAEVQPVTVSNGNGMSLHIDPRPKLSGAVVVTTPQAIATADVRKELNFCVKTQIPVLGVIENMAGYMCPCCGEISNVFSKGGGEVMAKEANIPFLGSVPIDTGFGALVEGVNEEHNSITQSGTANPSPEKSTELVEKYRECGLCPIFADFATTINQKVRGLSSS